MKIVGDKKNNRIVMKIFLFLSLLSVVVLFSFPCFAGDETEKVNTPKPLVPIRASNGSVYGIGKYGVILKYEVINEDQLYEGGEKVDFKAPKKGAKPGKKLYERSTHKFLLTLRTGIYKNIDARLVVPYLNKEMTRKSFNKDFVNSNEDIGDLKFIGRYAIMSEKKNDPLNLALGLGVKIPTGRTDLKDSNGDYLPGFLQPGSGSWDPIFEVGAHKVIGRSMITGHLMYQLATDGKWGDQTCKKPDVFSYNLGYVVALTQRFNLQCELNGTVCGKAKLEGVTQDNTGGRMLYITPGVLVRFYKNMHIGVCASVPIYRDLNGTQLSADYSLLTKLALPF